MLEETENYITKILMREFGHRVSPHIYSLRVIWQQMWYPLDTYNSFIFYYHSVIISINAF